MSENSSNDQLNENSSENDDDFRVSALLLRNDIKRRLHNGIEKRRKDKINHWICKLSELLPFKEPKRESKTHLLENIYQYINQLKEKNDSLMFGSVTTTNAIQVEEIRRLNKRCKELEEKNINYYRLLETAGISPNSWPKDIQFERPTKYSKKITEQQLSDFLAKNSDKKSDKNKDSGKRNYDSDENSGQSSNKRSKSSRSRSKKRKDRERERNLRFAPPTPVLPKTTEQSSPTTNTTISSSQSITSGQTAAPGSIVLLNDHNISSMNGTSIEDTHKIIVNTNNGFNGLNTFQFRPTVGPQQLQFLSTTPSIDGLNGNTNLLSGQILLNLNPPQAQPQATAVLLPNGQIVPIITQPQPPPPQPIILAPNQSFVLTTPTKAQPQPTIISGQTKTTVCSNIKSIQMNNNLTKTSNETQNTKLVSKEKQRKLTTTIETIVVSEKPIKKKVNKSIKKQIFSPKAKNTKKDKRKQINSKEEKQKSSDSEITDGKTAKNESETKNSKTSDKSEEKSVISSKDKNKIKSSSCDKSSNEKKINQNIVNSVKTTKNSKSKPVLTAMSGTPDSKMKGTSNCDILAKATQSIFSPPPNTCAPKQANGGNKKEVSLNINNNKIKDNNKWSGSGNGSRKDITINDNHIKASNKCKNTELESNRVKSESVIKSNQIEVISEFCANSGSSGADSSSNVSHRATSANIANKANIELINDTNKNDNYVHNRTASEENSKIEKTIASGNKAEINKKSVNNNLNNSNAIPSGGGAGAGVSTGLSSARNTASVENKLSNVSTHERTTLQANTCQSNASHQSFTHQNIAQNNDSDNNRLSFGFSSQQNQTNSNSISNENNTNSENQTIDNESELPSILLSLNDANEVSAESVHSVSNSSLPAFLSLSPEHLNEYLPKDNITNSADTDSANRDHTLSSDVHSVQFSPHTSVEQHTPIRAQEDSNRLNLPKDQQIYSQLYPKSNESSSVTNPSTESRSAYTSNFPISGLITNEYSNYFENFNPNPLMNPKMSSQNNNFLQFPLQNDNSFPPLYPMHSYPIHNYLQNNTNSNTTNNVNKDHNSIANRNTFFATNESQPSVVNNTTPKVAQNPNQSHSSQTRSQTTVMAPQQTKTTPTPPQSAQTQPQNQSNAVMPMRSQRNTSTKQQIAPPQRHQQQQPPQHTSPVAPNSNSTNKNNTNSSSVQYSTHNSFSSYSAEALIRQNEPTVQQIQSNEQNRYNTSGTTAPRLSQQSHTSANLPFSNERNSSRASISYSAESLIQSNPMNNSNQMSNKSTQREVENESLNGVNDNNNRISYYQHIGHNNTSNASNNLVQRPEQNNSNNLFNFDNSLNSRIMSSTSTSISQNCGNNYPQITFNSHLPDIRTATTSSESLFPITSNATTVNTNSNRTLSSNSISNNNSNTTSINTNNNNNQISHTVSNMGGVQQHSLVIYPSNNNQNSNSQQSKRSANNSFNSGVNAFIHSNADNYLNASHSTMYSTSGPPLVDPNLNPHQNQYQRSSRNSDLRFGNCLQPTNQNPSSSVAQHNNANTGCLFNTAPNTTYFPTSSSTPFPPLLPSAPSPFDPTAPFSTGHRPPMFPNTFMPDFNPPFVNTGTNTPLPHLSGTNFNINPSVSNNNNNNNNSSNSSNKRETHPTNTRSSSNLSRSPNQSKHSKITNSNTSKNKKQNNTKHNESSNNSSSRHSNDNCFSMNDLMSSTTPTNQSHNRYSNFVANTQTHNQSRQPIPSPTVSSSHSTNTKNVTSSADTSSSSYPLFRPQSQNVNNSSNVSNAANFSVNSLQNSNRTAPTTSAQPHFGSTSGAHHSSHGSTNFHLSNIFPDINSNNSESLGLSPMKFAPPVTPVVPPPVAPPLSQSMDANSYANHHSSGHHQNLYHSHHSSARISTPHNAFNTFLSSGTPSSHNTNNHPFDPHITPNNRTATHMTPNSSHSTSSLGATHPHNPHSYTVPSFHF